jgi:hypothetical protein
MKTRPLALFLALMPIVACNIDRDFLSRFDAGYVSTGPKFDAGHPAMDGATGTGGATDAATTEANKTDAGISTGDGATTSPDATADGTLAPTGGAGFTEHVEVSEPILPNLKVLYAAEGANFPPPGAARATLAHDAAWTFEYLLQMCQSTHPEIVIPGADAATTSAQDATNRGAVGACVSQTSLSKPYWTPALVNDVDICGTEMGNGWHLIEEDDVNSLSDTDAQALSDALSPVIPASGLGNNYFNLSVWVRGNDGSLRRGNLAPGVQPRVTDLPVPATSTVHYEGDLALRCVHRTKTPRARKVGFAQWVEVSPPILPNLKATYPYEVKDVVFPATHAERVTLAHEAALTFDFLVGVCSPTHPEIVIQIPGGPPPTPAQNAATFAAIAQCAAANYMSKPYWTPALVNEVDICATELGSHWHLIAEEDANILSGADAVALTAALSTPSGTGHVYFGMTVWIRGSDGSLRQGDLSQGTSPRVMDLPVPATSTIHYEGELALRCQRRTTNPTRPSAPQQ